MKKAAVSAGLAMALLTCVGVSPASAVDDNAIFNACDSGAHPEKASCHRICAIAEKTHSLDDVSHAARSTCQYALRVSEEKGRKVGGDGCSSKACIYKLNHIGKNRYAGAGYTVIYKYTMTGSDIFITDQRGRVSKYDQCGTCETQDYDSGPIRGATIEPGGSNAVVLRVPR